MLKLRYFKYLFLIRNYFLIINDKNKFLWYNYKNKVKIFSFTLKHRRKNDFWNVWARF